MKTAQTKPCGGRAEIGVQRTTEKVLADASRHLMGSWRTSEDERASRSVGNGVGPSSKGIANDNITNRLI
jgi:hypothetical protein